MLKQILSSIKSYILSVLLIALTGCTNVKWTGGVKANREPISVSQSAGADNGTDDNTAGEELRRNVIAYRYIPVPVPGQLMAMPSKKDILMNRGKTQHRSPVDLVKEANKKARYEPHSDQYFNAMLTYVYMHEAIYTVYTASGKITDIQMEPGEKINNIAAADSANWQIQTSPSGEGKQQIMHILVKPIISGITDNTLLVLTNKRTYHIYLKMTDNDTFMVSVKWSYPDKPDSLFIKRTGKPKHLQGGDGIDPSSMSFNYKWYSTNKVKPEWFPVQIFHDSSKTYIYFPDSFDDQVVLPILYVPDGNGGYSTLSNWRLLHKNTMVIDGVLQSAMLETGSVKGKRVSVMIKLVSDNGKLKENAVNKKK